MNYWNQNGFPHKGWACVDVEDRREDGQSENETDYASCEMCGNEKLRYVHIMSHPKLDQNLEVGCICAGKMSDDYLNPGRKENALKSKASRRSRWLTRNWKLSSKGNHHITVDGNHLLVFLKRNDCWGYMFNKSFGSKTFKTINEAKFALFEHFWNQTQSPTRILNALK
ncbi:MAG TPA: hypothetical protein VNJ01_00370 [Bacteriovoracaceae bacterium]|nr:hypothetical protein [Bacteriovoracaceae bacterium]